MAETTLTAFKAYLTASVNTNGVNSITGAILNTAFNYIADTLLWAPQRRAQAVEGRAISANDIYFVNDAGDNSPFAADTKVIMAGVRCYDTSGNNVDFQITAVDNEKFTIEVADDCSIDYVATSGGIESIPD